MTRWTVTRQTNSDRKFLEFLFGFEGKNLQKITKKLQYSLKQSPYRTRSFSMEWLQQAIKNKTSFSRDIFLGKIGLIWYWIFRLYLEESYFTMQNLQLYLICMLKYEYIYIHFLYSYVSYSGKFAKLALLHEYLELI